MTKLSDVEKIVNFLKAKTRDIDSQLQEYQSPIMQEMVKESTHLQHQFIRLKAQQEAYRDALLAIENFISNEQQQDKEAKDGQSRKGKKNKNSPGVAD